MMKSRKTVSAVLSAVMFCAAVPAFPAVHAADSGVPDWVPQDFYEAVDFQNTYGASRAWDGVYCIVERKQSDMTVECVEQLTEGSAECIFRKEIRYEVLDGMPDLESMSAKERAAWEAAAEQRSMEEQYNANAVYFVSAWKPKRSGENEIRRHYHFIDENGKTEAPIPEPVSYTFIVSTDALHVAETGWRSVTPDCEAEYEAFQEEHGNFYAYDDYIVMAATVNYSTGETMEMGVTSSAGELSPAHSINCRAQGLTQPPPGTAENFVRYYRVTETGLYEAKITWTEADSNNTVTTESRVYNAQLNTAGRIYLSDQESDVPWTPKNYDEADGCFDTNGSKITFSRDGLIYVLSREPAEGELSNCKEILKREYQSEKRGGISMGLQHYFLYLSVLEPLTPGEITAFGYQYKADRNMNLEYIPAPEDEWLLYVPGSYASAYYSWCEGGKLASSRERSHEYTLDYNGEYLISITRSYGGLYSHAAGLEKMMQNGKRLKTTLVRCDPRLTGGAAVEGDYAVHYVKITEPGTITVTYSDGTTVEPYFEQTITVQAVRDADGKITFQKEQEGAVPDWVPGSTEDCERFRWENGDWYAKDGLLCLCLPYEQSENTYYVLDDPGTAGDFAKHETLITRQYTGLERADSEEGWVVKVIKVTTPGNVGMKWVKVTETDDGRQLACKKVLFFTADGDLNIRDGAEPEDLSFLPASFEQAEAFCKKNGAISVHDGYVVCCGVTNLSTGYDILTDIAGTTGTNIVKKAEFGWELDDGSTGGNRTYQIYVLKPSQKGMLKVTARHARTWEIHEGTVLDTKCYNVSEDLLTLKEFKVTLGDLNGDSKMTVADAVTLSKYLGGSGELDGTQFFAADLLNDNRINAADLTLMKQQIMHMQ